MFNLGIVAVDSDASGLMFVGFACGHCCAWVNAASGAIAATQGCGPHTDMLLHMLFEAAQDDELANTLWRALVKRALASGAATIH